MHAEEAREDAIVRCEEWMDLRGGLWIIYAKWKFE
tara:strand:- start:20502 stop:20606 length:105 start_codon:yes stop_codon:yes gene_type:complete